MKCCECLFTRNKIYKNNELIEGDKAEYIYNNQSYCKFHLLKKKAIINKVKEDEKIKCPDCDGTYITNKKYGVYDCECGFCFTTEDIINEVKE